MGADARDFGLFLDGLRIDRSISRENLCENIISLSQYKRYLRGDASIPNNKLVLLADRLKFSISEIHIMYQKQQDKQYSKIIDIYYLLKQGSLTDAFEKANILKKEVFISNSNELFFNFCYIRIQHSLNIVSDVHVLELYSKMINYPECAKNESYSWIEITIMISIVVISSKIENFEPSNIMYRILTSDNTKFGFSSSGTYVPAIYSSLAQILGKQGKFNEVIEITDKGIEYCLKYESSNVLSLLFILKSYALFDVKQIDEALKSAKRAFMQLYIEDKLDEIEWFKKSFESRFNMKLEDLIKL